MMPMAWLTVTTTPRPRVKLLITCGLPVVLVMLPLLKLLQWLWPDSTVVIAATIPNCRAFHRFQIGKQTVARNVRVVRGEIVQMYVAAWTIGSTTNQRALLRAPEAALGVAAGTARHRIRRHSTRMGTQTTRCSCKEIPARL